MKRGQWRPASGHPSGRWRVGQYAAGRVQVELRTKAGSYVLFKTYESAKRRADKLNRRAA